MINTDNKLIYADLTYQIRGAIFNVYNTLGFGHKEQIYQKALEKEFTEINLPFRREVSLVEFMPKSFETQLLHYLKTTGFQLGLLVNFGAPKLIIRRLIWTDPRKSAPDPRKSNL